MLYLHRQRHRDQDCSIPYPPQTVPHTMRDRTHHRRFRIESDRPDATFDFPIALVRHGRHGTRVMGWAPDRAQAAVAAIALNAPRHLRCRVARAVGRMAGNGPAIAFTQSSENSIEGPTSTFEVDTSAGAYSPRGFETALTLNGRCLAWTTSPRLARAIAKALNRASPSSDDSSSHLSPQRTTHAKPRRPLTTHEQRKHVRTSPPSLCSSAA